MGIGEVLALAAAACWASSSFLYARARLPAWTINFAKNCLGASLVLVHLCIVGLVTGQSILSFGWLTWVYLIVSGLIGIALGDTFFFRSLQILGPRRTLVATTFAPVFGALFGWLILAEQLSAFRLIGIGVAISGVVMVVLDKSARQESPGHFPGDPLVGFLFGLGAAVCQAIAAAVSKLAMQDCTPLEATFVRLFASAVAALLVFQVSGSLGKTWDEVFQQRTLSKLIPAAALGTWIGIWFAQIGLKHADVAIVTMLLSTSPLFAIPLVRIVEGHPISTYSMFGTLISVTGIALAVSG